MLLNKVLNSIVPCYSIKRNPAGSTLLINWIIYHRAQILSCVYGTSWSMQVMRYLQVGSSQRGWNNKSFTPNSLTARNSASMVRLWEMIKHILITSECFLCWEQVFRSESHELGRLKPKTEDCMTAFTIIWTLYRLLWWRAESSEWCAIPLISFLIQHQEKTQEGISDTDPNRYFVQNLD